MIYKKHVGHEHTANGAVQEELNLRFQKCKTYIGVSVYFCNATFIT